MSDANATGWRERATLVLQQRSSALSKAEQIVGSIDVWHREYARHETC